MAHRASQGTLAHPPALVKETDMRLDHLHLQNFRCYEDAHFDFQPGFNLVVGVNGSGKTSLLLGVAIFLICQIGGQSVCSSPGKEE
ncbi:hypothetical protein ALQ32_01093 [Pseudomonas syringae pv. tagetis]|uniref:Rad50/SbcC-type AAA domain-containing protein n=2 Tax=Pseudomonas syringae group TaxID=136849 RepID=A0A3M3ZB66_9PSED|nr:hypothetical protein ALQ32_01093 [Pseudomonas syringae pv. tagetis]